MQELDGAKSGLSKEQKIGFILLLIFAFFTIGLGVMQIRNTMYGNFALKNSIPFGINEQINTIDALRFRDTDRDGLNDYEEIYVYGTSAYLSDSDGDGISDKDEIARGSDPLCAEGTNCGAASDMQGAVSSTLDNLPPPPTGLSPQDFLSMIQNPKEVRKMLLSSGVKPEVLDKITDADLMKMIQEMMSPNTTTTTNNNI